MAIEQEIIQKLRELEEQFSMIDVIQILSQYSKEVQETDEFKIARQSVIRPILKQLLKQERIMRRANESI